MLTHRRLLELLHYSPKTGVFHWRIYRCWQCPAGSVAGTMRNDGYFKICVDNKNYLAHRLAWFYVTGRWPKHDIDHRNHKTGDNRISNIRDGETSHNLGNQIKPKLQNKSGFLGVSWSKSNGRWVATISYFGKFYWLKGHLTPEAAHATYLKAKRKLHKFNTL